MRRSAWVGLALVTVIAIGGAIAAVRAVTPSGPVYSVAQVAAGLLRHPRAWAGRTVRVRGDVAMLVEVSPKGIGTWSARFCSAQRCAMPYPIMYPGARLHVILVDNGPPLGAVTMYELQREVAFNVPFSTDPSAVPHLMLLAQLPERSGLLATLRRLPLVGKLFPNPSPSTVPGHVERVYRVRILPRGQSRCTLGVWCYDGTLLGSA